MPGNQLASPPASQLNGQPSPLPPHSSGPPQAPITCHPAQASPLSCLRACQGPTASRDLFPVVIRFLRGPPGASEMAGGLPSQFGVPSLPLAALLCLSSLGLPADIAVPLISSSCSLSGNLTLPTPTPTPTPHTPHTHTTHLTPTPHTIHPQQHPHLQPRRLGPDPDIPTPPPPPLGTEASQTRHSNTGTQPTVLHTLACSLTHTDFSRETFGRHLCLLSLPTAA